MSTTTTMNDGRPLKAVWSPRDAGDAEEHIQAHVRTQKNLWGAFLTARDLLLGYIKTAGSTLAEVCDRWHLGGMVRMANRSVGWLFTGLGLVRRGVTTAGVRPGIAWLLSSAFGHGLLRSNAQALVVPVKAAGRAALQATTWTVRLFGQRGQSLAARLEAEVQQLHAAVARRTSAAGIVAGIMLHPGGLLMQALATFAKARVLTSVLTRFLSRRWHGLAHVAANLVVIPSRLRLGTVQTLLRATTPEPDPTPPATPAAAHVPDAATSAAASKAPVTPEPAAVGAQDNAGNLQASVTDLSAERVARHVAAPADPGQGTAEQLAEASGSYQRYPASKRSGNAKRKR